MDVMRRELQLHAQVAPRSHQQQPLTGDGTRGSVEAACERSSKTWKEVTRRAGVRLADPTLEMVVRANAANTENDSLHTVIFPPASEEEDALSVGYDVPKGTNGHLTSP